MPGSEAEALARLVLGYPARQVVGHAEIDRAALLAGGHVDEAGHAKTSTQRAAIAMVLMPFGLLAL